MFFEFQAKNFLVFSLKFVNFFIKIRKKFTPLLKINFENKILAKFLQIP